MNRMQLCQKLAGNCDGQEVEQESPVFLCQGVQHHPGLHEHEMTKGTELVRHKEKFEVSPQDKNKLLLTAACSYLCVGKLELLVKVRGRKFWLYIWKKYRWG